MEIKGNFGSIKVGAYQCFARLFIVRLHNPEGRINTFWTHDSAKLACFRPLHLSQLTGVPTGKTERFIRRALGAVPNRHPYSG